MDKPIIKTLEFLPCRDSGLDALQEEDLLAKNYLSYLNKFLLGKNLELHQIFLERPDLISSVQVKALFILNAIIADQKIHSYYISISQPNPLLLDNLAYELVALYSNLYKIFDIKTIDFYQYSELLPNLIIHFSDWLLSESRPALDYGLVYEQIRTSDKFELLVDEALIIQRHRLLSLYYRRMGDSHKAEEEQLIYVQKNQPSFSNKINLELLSPIHYFHKAEVLEHLGEIYQEVEVIQAEVLLRSGIYSDTCGYYRCSDCCHKNYPVVSLVEFLYIWRWIESNQIPKSDLIAKAQLIQKEHLRLYGSSMQIVDQINSSANVEGFQFSCPMLDEQDRCSIHPARPLACRAFGLSTINAQDVQACNFYLTQYQYGSSYRNERVVYDSRPHTAMIGSANDLLASQYGFGLRQPVGTLVAWLTCDKLNLSHLE